MICGGSVVGGLRTSMICGGGIAYLNDPDSYAGWSFYTPVRASQARQVDGQTSSSTASISLALLLFSLFAFLLF